MASWQSHAFGLLTRLTLKPAMRAGSSVEGLRTTANRFNALLGALPSGTRLKSIEPGPFTAEWVSVPESDPRRVLLHFPGGAFIMRIPPAQRSLVARICQQARARALLVHYRLAPEDPFPAGLEDCLTAYHYLLDQGVGPENIVIGGESAGGCMVLTTLLSLRDRGHTLPAGAYALSPVADLSEPGVGSRSDNRWLDAMLPLNKTLDIRGLYLGVHQEMRRHPHVSPVFGDYTGLPPLLLQVGSTETLRDDSVRVAAKARAAGVTVEVEIWEDMPHVWQLAPFLPESKRAIGRLGEFIRRHTLALEPR